MNEERRHVIKLEQRVAITLKKQNIEIEIKPNDIHLLHSQTKNSSPGLKVLSHFQTAVAPVGMPALMRNLGT